MYTLLYRAVVAAPPHALRASLRGFHSSSSSRGIFDTLRDFASSRVATNQDVAKKKTFDLQRAFLADSPSYTLLDHQALLERIADNAGVKSWKTMMMSDAQKSELAENLVDLKIVACFTAAEVAAFKPGSASGIDGKAKERAAKELSTDVARVNRFLANYTQSFAVHQWLQERKAKGQAIPVSQEEFNMCAVQDKVAQRELCWGPFFYLSSAPSPFCFLTPSLPPTSRRRRKAAGLQQGGGAAEV